MFRPILVLLFQMHEFLRGTAWQDATLTPIAGDASARQYARFDQPPAILMTDPSGDTLRFANIASTLTNADLCPPTIYAHNPDQGLMIISDLGQTDFAKHLKQSPHEEPKLYKAATDVLCHLHDKNITVDVPRMTHETAADMIGLAAKFYANDPTKAPPLCDAMLNAFTSHVDPSLHLALRDYHAENLIWRPMNTGTDRVGILDFQDACIAPLGYDLMSLIRDARRDVDHTVGSAITLQFCNHIGRNAVEMGAHLACVGAQRNLRVLGIFARLASQGGKPQYLQFIPRVWRYLMQDLSHPALRDLNKSVMSTLPTPNASTLQRLGSK